MPPQSAYDPTYTPPGPVPPGQATAGFSGFVGTNTEQKPNNPSSDYEAMAGFWNKVATIIDGADAMRAAGKTYLPKFTQESDKDYDERRSTAKFTNIYKDILENLAAKPFAKEVQLKDGASQAIQDICEDIDGRGNSLHVFCSKLFFNGINDGLAYILVDKKPVPTGASLAAERDMGARPYWVMFPARCVLAVYTDIIDGKEQFVHVRIHEPEKVRKGYKDVFVNRVRELNRDKLPDGTYGDAYYVLHEEQSTQNGEKVWVEVDRGPIGIGIIPPVPFITGHRKETSWQFIPPMKDAADLQVEHYQQEANLKAIKTMAAFPMLSGEGVNPPTNEDGSIKVVPVGPKTVLYAPMGEGGKTGSWKYISPDAATLIFLASEVKVMEDQLRELGRQPLTAQTGNLTVVTTAFAAQKGNSAIQAWALGLKDSTELALEYTAMWLADTSEPEVQVHTDFAVDMETDKAPDFLLKLHESKVISRKALVDESKRRDLLSPEYDAEADAEEIAKEAPDTPTAADLMGALGNVRPIRPAGLPPARPPVGGGGP